MSGGIGVGSAVMFLLVALVTEVRRARRDGLDAPRYGFLRTPSRAVSGALVLVAVLTLTSAFAR